MAVVVGDDAKMRIKCCNDSEALIKSKEKHKDDVGNLNEEI